MGFQVALPQKKDMWQLHEPLEAQHAFLSSPMRSPSRRGTRHLFLAALLLACSLWSDARPLGIMAAAAGVTPVPPSHNVAVSVVQQATTDGATRSLSFLSAGYQSRSAFLADVATCMATLTNSTGGVAADPWPRYISLFNVYALFESSAQLGASRPLGPGYDCTFMNNCSTGYVSNNLHCAFGSPNPQVLSCDINLVRSVASYAPAQDVVVVLVNDAEPSGAGTDGVVYITNMPAFMPFMLVHYLNRAVAGLQEEYSLGIRATSGGEIFASPNCAAPSSTRAQEWAYWQKYSNEGLTSANNASSSNSGSEAHGAGCSIASYVAPTHGGCLMQNSSLHQMCPICKEQLSVSFYDAGVTSSALVSPSKARLNLAAGRCPPENHMAHVATAAVSDSAGFADVTPHLYLSLGPFALLSDVSVVWRSANGTVLATNTQTLSVMNVSSVWTLPTIVTATIVDATPNVRPSLRASRGADMTATTTFTVMAWSEGVNCASSAAAAAATCFSSRATFADMTAPPTGTCSLPYYVESTALPGAVDLPPSGTRVTNPPRETEAIIISSTVCGGATLLLVLVATILHHCCVYRRPREVLNPTPADRVVDTAVVVMAPLGMALAGVTIAIICSFVPVLYYTASPVILTMLATACVVYVIAMLNFCGVLLRWFRGVLACGIVLMVLGGGLLATGLFALVFYFDRGSRGFSHRMSDLWQKLLASPQGTAYLCDTVQTAMKCSGFHAGCFMTASAECPANCVSNVHFVSGCELPFMHYVGGLYLPVAVVALACGFWFVLLGTLDMTYYVRFRQLPRNGRLRRAYRTTRTPPMAPVTFQEVKEVRRMFALVCAHVSTMTIDGDTAVRFLTTVFAEPLSEAYQRRLRACAPLTFDALMTIHFPYATQPTALLPQPTAFLPQPSAQTAGANNNGGGAVSLDLDRYAAVAGALSPEALQQILHTYEAQDPLPTHKALLRAIGTAAAHSESAAFCHGLGTAELAGLRQAWASLHPAVSGTLTDAELVTFYAWSHAGAPPLSAEGLVQWKEFLDVTRSGGGVGWREFCYPYAQKALNVKAEVFLKEQGYPVPSGVVTRATVAHRYGSEGCRDVFLPREKAAPMARVAAHLLAPSQSPSAAAAAAAATRASRKSPGQRMEGIVKSLKEMEV